ncbi:MAG: uracil-DNA glycosylase [Actinobacteria bacterium]|nr:uracil-DNA glycosylase [Actinomycetota bacterium]
MPARTIPSLHRELAACRRCLEAGYPIASLPVFEGRAGQRAYLFGLAPGIAEGDERRPWRGRAGATLRRWLELDEEGFYETFYCASVTRCFPGRSASGRGDRTATAAERALCLPWHEAELRLLRPDLVVTVGLTAARRLVGIASMTEAVGKSYTRDGAIVIPLPHPSGASGWLNDTTNRRRLGKALTHVRREITRLAETG